MGNMDENMKMMEMMKISVDIGSRLSWEEHMRLNVSLKWAKLSIR